MEKTAPEAIREAPPPVSADVDAEKAPQEPVHQEKNAVILARSWTKRALIVAFSSLFLATFILSFIKYSAKTYSAYAASAFSKHSALSTANVVYTIINLVTYPIMAKLSNVFGRGDGFVFAVLTLTLSQALYAGCHNIATYIASGIFDAIGETGFTIMQQVFIADTTSLLDRGIWSSLPESVTAIPTLYLGTIVADKVLEHSTWRWGYGMWAIILPFAAAPLIITMFILQHRAKKNGYKSNSTLWREVVIEGAEQRSMGKRLHQFFWIELDLFGAFLLVAGLSLTLIPLSLTGSSNSNRWQNGSIIAMLVIGIVVSAAFFLWDGKFAKQPFVPFRMIKEPTIVAAMVLSILDFIHYACFTTFFPSFLQVAGDYSAGHASRIDNGLRVSFQIASVIVGVMMKYSKRSQIFVHIGVPLLVFGQGLQCYFTNEHGTHVGNEPSFVTGKVLVGVGRAFYQTAAQVSIQALVPKSDVAVVTGIYYAAMNFGSAIGTSVGGAIWNNMILEKLTKYLPDEYKSKASSIYGSITVAKSFAVGTEARDAINLTYRETQQTLAIAATAALAPMLIVMFFMKNVDLVKRQAEQDAACKVVSEEMTHGRFNEIGTKEIKKDKTSESD